MLRNELNKKFNSIKPEDLTVKDFFSRIETALHDIADSCPLILENFNVSAPIGGGYHANDYCITIGNVHTYIYGDTNEQGQLGMAQYDINRSASETSLERVYVGQHKSVEDAVTEISKTIDRTLKSQEYSMS